MLGLAGPVLLLFLFTGFLRAPAPTKAEPPTQHAGEIAHPPVPIEQTSAVFPPKARRKKVAGECLVSMIVDTSGDPQDVKVIHCSDSVFAQNSLKAAEKYRFKPAEDHDGKPVSVPIQVQIDFQISGEARTSEPIIQYSLHTPPGVVSGTPDTHGVYPLSKSITPPVLNAFPEVGFPRPALNPQK